MGIKEKIENRQGQIEQSLCLYVKRGYVSKRLFKTLINFQEMGGIPRYIDEIEKKKRGGLVRDDIELQKNGIILSQDDSSKILKDVEALLKELTVFGEEELKMSLSRIWKKIVNIRIIDGKVVE